MRTIGEGRARAIDAAVKIVSVGALVIGGAWTLFTYVQTREKEAESTALEARKPFEEKRLDFCFWAIDHTSFIASSTDPNAVANHTNAFWALLFGEAGMVEDQKVIDAMVEFGSCLKKPASCGDASLKQLSLNLGRACRESVAKNWRVDLPPNSLTAEQFAELTGNSSPAKPASNGGK